MPETIEGITTETGLVSPSKTSAEDLLAKTEKNDLTDDTTGRKSSSALLKNRSAGIVKIISGHTSQTEYEENGTEKDAADGSTESLSGRENPSLKTSKISEESVILSSFESGREGKIIKYDGIIKKKKRFGLITAENGEEDDFEEELAEESEQEISGTLLRPRYSGSVTGVSRQESPDLLDEEFIKLKTQRIDEERASTVPKKETPIHEDWSDEVWLQIAARQRAVRRSRKNEDIALRKEKYPELFRSDVSIHPSYTEYKVPYFAIARQRYLRSLRIIQEQIHGDIQEMALLQPRALDGVRIIRTFQQGVAPDTLKFSLNVRDRWRLERLLREEIY